MIGQILGPYQITAKIGAGGMGEVYRAHDRRLGREVAIKVLPSGFSLDADRLRRFEQEARAAAALNHPNILAVYDIGTHESAPYVVSELLDGETLRVALDAGPLPARRALEYAIQIANGLGAAHEKGIVHRDLKPENIFITRDGRVKILDFGLAKLVEGAAAGAPGSASAAPGATALLTRSLDTAAGVVLGTIGYMSPEQVRGQAVDHRSDIFSFGAVFYEMLTGRRAFAGETPADTISAILRNDLPELTITGSTPVAALDRIVRHCVEKTPELRFQSARDVAFHLQSLSDPHASGMMPVAPASRQRWPRRLTTAGVATAGIAVGLIAGFWWGSRDTAGVATFSQVTFRHGDHAKARFTADGQNIVYTAAWEGKPPEIFTVPTNGTGGRPLDLKNAVLLAVSRTGELAIGLSPTQVSPFLMSTSLGRGTMTGGPPKPEIDNVVAADYMPDGTSLAVIRYVKGRNPALCVLEYPVGKALMEGPFLSDVRISPDGRHIAVLDHVSPGDDRGEVVILNTDGSRVLRGPTLESIQGLAWTPSGSELFVSSPLHDAALRAIDLKGRIRQVFEVPGRAFLRDVSSSGHVLVDHGTVRFGMVANVNGQGEHDVSWLDYSFFRGLTDDGKTVYFDEEGRGSGGAGYRSYIRDIDGSPAIEIGEGYALALSADRQWMLSQRFPQSGVELWLVPVGAGQAKRLSPPGLAPAASARFFADTKRIMFTGRSGGGKPVRTYVQSLDGGQPTAISEAGVAGIAISPDQKWIYATSSGGPVLLASDGSAVKKVLGIEADDDTRIFSGWTSDGRIYATKDVPTGYRVDVLDPFTGKREPKFTLQVPGLNGLNRRPPTMTPDGRSYAYSYTLLQTDLFVLTGVR